MKVWYWPRPVPLPAQSWRLCTHISVYIIPVVTAMGTVGLFSCSAPSYAIACRATQGAGAGHASMQMDTQGGVGAALLVAVRVSVQGAQFSQTGVFPCHRHHGGPSLHFHNSFSIPSASSSSILSIIKIYSKHTREKNCLVVLRVIRFLLLEVAWFTSSLVWKVRVIWVITAFPYRQLACFGA